MEDQTQQKGFYKLSWVQRIGFGAGGFFLFKKKHRITDRLTCIAHLFKYIYSALFTNRNMIKDLQPFFGPACIIIR